MSPRLIALLVSAVVLGATSQAADPPKPSPAQIDFFENKVRPILAEHCYSCHGSKKQQAGLRLDIAAGVRKGTDDGPVIVAGDLEKSKLIKSIRHTGDYAMPPNKPMPKVAIETLESWVKMGAPYPEGTTQVTPSNNPKTHWAYQPVKDSKPAIQAVNPIDGFILSKLRDVGLSMAPVADKRTLIRRAYYDLIGLPPTAQQIDAFISDQSPKAFEKLVDELLKSPHFGERWARHWLDLARYADSKGYVFTEDRNYPYAYTYRDYVIRAFNEDKPYTQFITEQLAADRLNLSEAKKLDLAALGFLTVGRRFSNNIHDIIDDRIDVVTRTFLGLTMQCARCHDHKYDPVPISDYYTLYGFFSNSPEPKDYPLIGKVERTPELIAFEAELQKRELAVREATKTALTKRKTGFAALTGPSIEFAKTPDRLLNRADRNEIGKLQKRVDQHKSTSAFNPPRAMVLNDAPNPGESFVFLRGNPGTRGPKTPRVVPASLTARESIPVKSGSGRLELAQAIADPKNPLTARVAVNRIWEQLFGTPLVNTPSDFGFRSEPPSHPELLDWLATRFMQDGWSMKSVIRRIMLSQTYQQSSTTSAEALLKDPENRRYSHVNRRRLDYEGLRDGLLSVSGKLDRAVYGRSVDLFARPFTTRRTVYASIDRQNLPGTFRVFDFSNPDQHAPSRVVTTVPQQALFLMNSPFVAEQAQALVAKLNLATPALAPLQRVEQLYLAILGRKPTKPESAMAVTFLTEAKDSKDGQLNAHELLAQVLMLSNEFAFID
jgi:hypothetical protein